MTSPQDPQQPLEREVVVPPTSEVAPEDPAALPSTSEAPPVVPAPEPPAPASWSAPSEPEVEEEADTPAWADEDLFTRADEPEYDEWAAEQDPFLPADAAPEAVAVAAPEDEPVAETEPMVEPEPVAEPEPAEAAAAAPPEVDPEPQPGPDPSSEVAGLATAALTEPVVAEQVAPAPFAPTEVLPEPEEPPAEAVEEPEAEEPVVPETRSASVLVTLLAVAVAVLVGLTAFLAVATVRSRGDGEDNRRAALAGARNAARLVFSYDYRQLSKDFAAGRALTTGAFRSEYDRTTERLVNDVAPRYKAVVAADVSDAAVVSANGDRATVLVFVDQQSSSTLSSAPKLTQSRLEMSMVRSGGQWKVAKIKAF